MADIVAELRIALLGWKAHFGIAEVLSPLRDIDKWLRRKLRCTIWKQWGRSGLPEATQTRRKKRTRPVASVENPGAIAGLASKVLPQFRSAIPRRMTGICSLNRRVRSRMHGGVGGGGVCQGRYRLDDAAGAYPAYQPLYQNTLAW